MRIEESVGCKPNCGGAALASTRAPGRKGAVSFQPNFLSIFGTFCTVVETIKEKFCMHVETDEFDDVSENLSEFENSKRFISQTTTPI
jgi:hypothetical protein